MKNDLFLYRQAIADGGHKLVTPIEYYEQGSMVAPSSRSPEVSVMPCDPFGYRTIKHASLLDSNLFIKFSQLDRDDESILSFANEFGLLGIGVDAAVDEYKAGEGRSGGVIAVSESRNINHRLVSVEPLSMWHRAITEMAKVVYLWELKVKSKRAELNKIIKWEESEQGLCVRYDIEIEQGSFHGTVYSHQISPTLLEKAQRGNIDLPLLRIVQQSINKIYSENVSPLMIFDRSYQKIVHQIVPKNLLGFMWLQFARAFEDGAQYSNCKECGGPFMSNKSRGNPRQFCSDPCKSLNWRKQKTI